MAFTGRKKISEIRSDLVNVLGRSGEVITPRGVTQVDEYARASAEKLLKIRKVSKQANISSGNTGNYSDSSFQFGSLKSRISGPIDKNVLEQVYGSADEAFGILQRFEDDYFAALNAANKKGAGINISMIKARGVIDLNQLPKAQADQLMNQFMSDVIKVRQSAGVNAGPTLTSVAGLPGMQVPSTNDYTESLFRYVVDQNGGSPGPRAYHPMQILLNAVNFQFKSGKPGVEALTVSKTMPSVATLRSVMSDIGDGFKGNVNTTSDAVKSLVFDVETTGVTKGSSVRSLTIAEQIINPDGSKTINTIMNFSFDSPQLRGLREVGVGATGRSIVESLAEKEGTELIDVGPRGENVVAKLTEVMEMMTDTQYRNIVAHNSQFDIQMLMRTVTEQEAYNTDQRAKEAFERLNQRIEQDPSFVRDTIHKSRVYQLNEAYQIIDNLLQDPNVSMDDLNKTYINALFAEEQLPLIGRKNVGYSSVTNIALNTNLFELMEQDQNARKVFDSITRGSHIAETDVLLQGYMEMYMNEGKLATWPLTQQQGGTATVKTATGDFLRNIVARSSAVTPTTDVDDVYNLSNYLTTRILSGSEEESIRAVSGAQIRVIGSDSQVRDSLTRLGLSEDLGRGVISVDPDGVIRFASEAGEIGDDLRRVKTPVDQSKGLRFIRETIEQARSGKGPSIKATTASGQVLSDNLARQSIVSFGVNVSSNQAADDIGIAARVLSSAGAPAILGFDRATQESLDILESGLTAVYRNLGSKANISSAIAPRAAGVEPPPVLTGGMAQYGPKQIADLAESLNAIGDPFHFLDPQSRYTSTYLAAITSQDAANATMEVRSKDLTPAQRLLHPRGKKLGTTQGLGIVYSSSISDDYFRLFGASADAEPVPIMSDKLFKMFAEKAGINLDQGVDMKLSLVDSYEGKMVNLKTLFGQTGGPLTKDNATALATQIVEAFSDESSLRTLASEMGFETKDIDFAFRDSYESRYDGNTQLRKLYENYQNMQHVMRENGLDKDRMAARLAETINEKGVVTQRLSPDVYDEVVQLAENLGRNYQNDVEMPVVRRVFDAPGGSANVVYDPDLIDRLGMRAQFEEAVQGAEQSFGEISQRLDATRNPVRRDPLLDDISREAGYTRRAVLADTYDRVADAFAAFKSKVPGGSKSLAGIAGAAVIGLMAYNKSQQNELYNQTVEKQPYEPTNYVRSENQSLGYLSPNNSSRRDPLLTAGVVGNLDRNKINHTRMGNNKYDHLF